MKVLAAVLAFAGASAAAAADAPLPGGVVLRLPAGASAGWLLPPEGGAPDPSRSRFEVEPGETLWFSPYRSALLRRSPAAAFFPAEPYRDFAFLDRGQLVACTEAEFGGVELQATGGVPTLAPAMRLPMPDCRLFAAGNDVLLAGSREDATQDLYLLSSPEFGKGKLTAVKLLNAPGKIKAAAAADDGVYVGIGRAVFRLAGGKAEPYFVHPDSDIVDLAAAGGGVFYSTDGSAGFVGGGKHVPFLEAGHPRLRSRAGKLYVYLPEHGGVLRIAGASGFMRAE